jgi:hypothetical protein
MWKNHIWKILPQYLKLYLRCLWFKFFNFLTVHDYFTSDSVQYSLVHKFQICWNFLGYLFYFLREKLATCIFNGVPQNCNDFQWNKKGVCILQAALKIVVFVIGMFFSMLLTAKIHANSRRYFFTVHKQETS